MASLPPISLCDVIVKITMKAMTERLKPIMLELIGLGQTGFIKGRNTHDTILVAQELVHQMHNSVRKPGYMILKIELTKAYDRISWNFIQDTLELVNIPFQFHQVAMQWIKTASMHVMWNGVPSEEFQPQRGICQGDSLSLLIFVLCMEHLVYQIHVVVPKGWWISFCRKKNAIKIPYLSFPDDLLFIMETSTSQARLIMWILEDVCIAFGLAVNLSKSMVYFSKTDSSQTRIAISTNLGMSVTEKLGKYLGGWWSIIHTLYRALMLNWSYEKYPI